MKGLKACSFSKNMGIDSKFGRRMLVGTFLVALNVVIYRQVYLNRLALEESERFQQEFQSETNKINEMYTHSFYEDR